ncbi:hypothetical protein BG004_001772 [Podila humilis]|nr:hypothetical protein BG004_001772 [Podila humilis]
MKEPPTRKTKQSSTTHVTPLQGDAQSTHGEFRPTFYNPFEIKHRQRVTRSQLKVLEKAFAENPLPPGSTRQQLSIRLSMTPRTIQIWFQNRRAKSKQISTQTSGHGVDQNVADSQTPMPTNTGTTSVFESSSSAEPQGVQPGDAVDPFDFDDAQSSIVPSQQHSFHVDGSEPLDQNILVSAQASIADKNDILDNGKNDLSLSNVYVSDLSTETLAKTTGQYLSSYLKQICKG